MISVLSTTADILTQLYFFSIWLLNIRIAAPTELYTWILGKTFVLVAEAQKDGSAKAVRRDIEVGEDRTFNIQYALNIRSFTVLEKSLYYICLENEASLSRKKRDDLDEQIEKAEEHLREVLRESDLSEEEKLKIIEAINFDNLRAVYTKAKYLHRNKLPYFKRLKELNKYCKQVNDRHFTYPSGKFCTLIKLPVVLKITPLIDAMSWVLTRWYSYKYMFVFDVILPQAVSKRFASIFMPIPRNMEHP